MYTLQSVWIERALQNNKDICQILVEMKGTCTNDMFSDCVELSNMNNVRILKEPNDVKETINLYENPMFIKQRSDEWLEVNNIKM